MSFIRANFDDENFDAPKRVEPTRDAPFSVFGNVGSPYTLSGLITSIRLFLKNAMSNCAILRALARNAGVL